MATTTFNQQQSLSITKKLLRTSFGCIAYLRNFFPEENFEDGKEGDVRVKIVKRGYSVEADSLVNWLEGGIFDALVKNYLKTVEFGIFLDERRPQVLVEKYTFHVAYNDGHAFLQHIETERFGTGREEDWRTASSRQKIAVLGEVPVSKTVGESLPSNKFITARIYYWDDATPLDYEPQFFMSASDEPENQLRLESESTAVSFGKLKTPFHTMDMQIEAIDRNLEVEPQEGDSEIWVPDSSPMPEFPHGISDDLGIRSQHAAVVDSRQVLNTLEELPDGLEDDRIRTTPSPCETSTEDHPRRPINSPIEDPVARVTLETSILSAKTDAEETAQLVRNPVEFDSAADIDRQKSTWKERSFVLVSSSQSGSSSQHTKRPSTKSRKSRSKRKSKAYSAADGADAEGVNSCVCGTLEDDGDMKINIFVFVVLIFMSHIDKVQCDVCEHWSHLWCYGYTSFEDPRIPERHVCADCLAQKSTRFSRKPVDIVSLAIQARRRRGLMVVWLEGYSGSHDIFLRLNLNTKEQASSLERYLILEGFIAPKSSSNGASIRARSSVSRDGWVVVRNSVARTKLRALMQPLEVTIGTGLESEVVTGSEKTRPSSGAITSLSSSQGNWTKTDTAVSPVNTSSAASGRLKSKTSRPYSAIRLGDEVSSARSKRRRKCSKEQTTIAVL
ncbi:HORMA domain-containing protein [Dissophora ornata]|nr:HORMA domain-containing protein [Dissophora ornata]